MIEGMYSVLLQAFLFFSSPLIWLIYLCCPNSVTNCPEYKLCLFVLYRRSVLLFHISLICIAFI